MEHKSLPHRNQITMVINRATNRLRKVVNMEVIRMVEVSRSRHRLMEWEDRLVSSHKECSNHSLHRLEEEQHRVQMIYHSKYGAIQN